MLEQGLYEQVVNQEIAEELRNRSDDEKHIEKIDAAEAPSILTQYLSEVVRKGLDRIAGEDISAQLALVNKVVNLISQETDEEDLQELSVTNDGEQLLALLSADDAMVHIGQKKAKDIPRPETSIAQSSLFTGAIHEPQMFSELKKEIATADRIDMLVSFVKWSGLRLIIEDLREFTDRGGMLRVITTTYMGATDVRAVEELRKLSNTEIRISYDVKRTRLHAKAYMFYRGTGFTTAYVGSSNLSNPAMSSGLEWNVKLTTKDMLPTIQKMEATFASYWNTSSFERYEEGSKDRLEKALTANVNKSNPIAETQYIFDIQPYPYQQEILDQLQAEREVRGYTRNLVVAATGTGKTLISAFDYRRFCKSYSGTRPRLLFVAHREEILEQSCIAFRAVLKDPNFGELYVGNNKPNSLDHLFISVQTMASQRLYDYLRPDYYDYVIVDEFHHAAAPTYQGILNHFVPKILLGLTATPECVEAGVREDYSEPGETVITKSYSKFVAVDSRRWIRFLIKVLPELSIPMIRTFSAEELRMLQMFYITVFQKAADLNTDETIQNLQVLSDSPTMIQELLDILELNMERIDFVDCPVDLGFDCPLDRHCTYTRDQILIAMDYMTPGNVREGVKWLPDKQIDVFFVTLNKSDKDYSPTTMYNDYSINESLFHWQSQSTTSATSTTGQRYIHHRETGSRIALFVREFKNDSIGAAPYTYLGTASYVEHYGSKPMNITWHLDHPIPAKYLRKTNKLVVG